MWNINAENIKNLWQFKFIASLCSIKRNTFCYLQIFNKIEKSFFEFGSAYHVCHEAISYTHTMEIKPNKFKCTFLFIQHGHFAIILACKTYEFAKRKTICELSKILYIIFWINLVQLEKYKRQINSSARKLHNIVLVLPTHFKIAVKTLSSKILFILIVLIFIINIRYRIIIYCNQISDLKYFLIWWIIFYIWKQITKIEIIMLSDSSWSTWLMKLYYYI